MPGGVLNAVLCLERIDSEVNYVVKLYLRLKNMRWSKVQSSISLKVNTLQQKETLLQKQVQIR